MSLRKVFFAVNVGFEENGLESVAHSPYPTNVTPKGEQTNNRLLIPW